MLTDKDLAILFTKARTHSAWLDKDVSNKMLQKIYDLLKFAPTAANSCPMRLTFIKSQEAKQKLKPCLDEANIKKSMSAPVVSIIAYDTEFYEKLAVLFPHDDARSWYAGKPDKIKQAGEMNATLQGAYFMLAARSIGLDCGPIGGFDANKIDKIFFPDGKNKSIFLCNLGYGDATSIFPRLPRLDFYEACKIV